MRPDGAVVVRERAVAAVVRGHRPHAPARPERVAHQRVDDRVDAPGRDDPAPEQVARCSSTASRPAACRRRARARSSRRARRPSTPRRTRLPKLRRPRRRAARRAHGRARPRGRARPSAASRRRRSPAPRRRRSAPAARRPSAKRCESPESFHDWFSSPRSRPALGTRRSRRRRRSPCSSIHASARSAGSRSCVTSIVSSVQRQTSESRTR